MLTFVLWECQVSRSEMTVHVGDLNESAHFLPAGRESIPDERSHGTNVLGVREFRFSRLWHKDCLSLFPGPLRPDIILF